MAKPIGAGSRDEDDALEVEQELAFAERVDRLPWLESEDDDDEPAGGVGRTLAFAVLALLGLALLLGLLWWFSHKGAEQTQVAEGSLIEAPEGPYKVKPASPGGRQVAGTGATSFQVAEGRQVEGRIAEGAASVPSPEESATPVAGAIGVQVGAYSSRDQAEAGWAQLSGRLPPLSGRSHRVLEGAADSGTVFRLQAVAGSVKDAEALCHAIRAAGGDCQVKR